MGGSASHPPIALHDVMIDVKHSIQVRLRVSTEPIYLINGHSDVSRYEHLSSSKDRKPMDWMDPGVPTFIKQRVNGTDGECEPYTECSATDSTKSDCSAEPEKPALVAASSKHSSKLRSYDLYIYGNPHNHKPFLHPNSLDYLIPFLFGWDYVNCLACCPHWFMTFTGWLESKCNRLTQNFSKTYSDYLQVCATTIKYQPVFTASKFIRLDWIIIAKILPKCSNRSIKFSYNFLYNHKSHNGFLSEANAISIGKKQKDTEVTEEMSNEASYNVKYQFDAFPRYSARTIWVCKDICRFHGDETQVAVMSPIPSVCVNDRLEVAVNLLNAFGLADTQSVSWQPITRLPLPASRPPTVELECQKWYNINEYRFMTTERMHSPEDLSPLLQLKSTLCTGLDIAVTRSEYKVVSAGVFGEFARKVWGADWHVVNAKNPIICPLTRLGLQHDRFLSVQVRVGDTILYYLCRGGSNIS